MKKLLFLFATLVLFSCEKKEVAPGQGEINAEQLMDDVKEYNILGVYVYEPSNDEYREWEMPINEMLAFAVDDNFITVSYDSSYKVTYDLSKLLKYSIDYRSKTMSLYFSR